MAQATPPTPIPPELAEKLQNLQSCGEGGSFNQNVYELLQIYYQLERDIENLKMRSYTPEEISSSWPEIFGKISLQNSIADAIFQTDGINLLLARFFGNDTSVWVDTLLQRLALNFLALFSDSSFTKYKEDANTVALTRSRGEVRIPPNIAPVIDRAIKTLRSPKNLTRLLSKKHPSK